MKYTFSGPTGQVYPQYLDLAKGSTLVAEPGETYDIAVAEGHPDDQAMPPDDRWSAPKGRNDKKADS